MCLTPRCEAAAKEVRQAGAVQPLLRALFTEEWLGFEFEVFFSYSWGVPSF